MSKIRELYKEDFNTLSLSNEYINQLVNTVKKESLNTTTDNEKGLFVDFTKLKNRKSKKTYMVKGFALVAVFCLVVVTVFFGRNSVLNYRSRNVNNVAKNVNKDKIDVKELGNMKSNSADFQGGLYVYKNCMLKISTGIGDGNGMAIKMYIDGGKNGAVSFCYNDAEWADYEKKGEAYYKEWIKSEQKEEGSATIKFVNTDEGIAVIESNANSYHKDGYSFNGLYKKVENNKNPFEIGTYTTDAGELKITSVEGDNIKFSVSVKNKSDGSINTIGAKGQEEAEAFYIGNNAAVVSNFENKVNFDDYFAMIFTWSKGSKINIEERNFDANRRIKYDNSEIKNPYAKDAHFNGDYKKQ